LLASTVLAGAYMLSNRNIHWLWIANVAIVLNWFGDSLDGNLARYRKIERPRYGYYLDHLTDAYSTLAVGVGLGLSPFMLLSVGLAISITYLVMSINVYLETHVFGQFNLGYGRFGPTEARVILIVLNSLAVMWTDLPFRVHGIGATLFDLVGLSAVAGMLTLLLIRIAKNLRTLAALEPPRRR
jgi:phosphatidylglycerophosphate synthase